MSATDGKERRVLMSGNEAMAEAAIRAGCRYYFGYPITPQNEVPAYMARRMPQVGGTFIQAESELASINMVFGASAAGGRVMTSSSSPGMSLFQEGLSYICAGHLPCVVANVMRGGPGLGNIAPSQGDYFQAVKGGGHGDYRLIALTPNSVQETVEMTYEAFELAERYRVPTLILTDGILGQMTEPVLLPDPVDPTRPERPWALTGAKGREKNTVQTLWLKPEDAVKKNNLRLQESYARIEAEILRYEEYRTEDAEAVLVAFGLVSRICRSVVDRAREEGLPLGLLRPRCVWPFPAGPIDELAGRVKGFVVVEMNAGQMLEDVRLAVRDRRPVGFVGEMGGPTPSAEAIFEEAAVILGKVSRARSAS